MLSVTRLITSTAILVPVVILTNTAALASIPIPTLDSTAQNRSQNEFNNLTTNVKKPKPSKNKKKTKKNVDVSDPRISNESGRLEGDIVVTGLRENVRTARAAKRRAHQIVDVVLAQDIGKLPDKNVPEALARVPGVQIDRDRGEGGQVRIRGLDGVMTTINGSPTFSTGDRTTYLNDISSDLIAGIEVYKTRTPDQVEGSQTGVINLTMRRPTDFKLGATYAINVRGDYADQIKRINPYVSALVAYNAETPIGKLGFSVNGTFNRVSYQESMKWNGLPDWMWDNRQVISTGTTPTNIYVPRAIGFAGTDGWSKRAAVNVSTQWKPNDKLSFVLEGGFSNQKMLWADSGYIIPVTTSGSAVPPPTLSDIVLSSDGRLVKSLTMTSIDPQGPGRESFVHETSNYNGRFQVNYVDERVDLSASANYVRSDNDSDNINHWIRFNKDPSYKIIFNDDRDPRGGPTIELVGVDLMDPNNYRYIDGFGQSRQYTYSAETELKTDIKVNTFANFIDYIKVGFRYANRTYDRNYGRRDYGNLRLPIADLPDYKLTPAGQTFQGAANGTNVKWLIGDTGSIRESWNAIRAKIVGLNADLANYYPTYQPWDFFTGSDGSMAAYGMVHYNVNLLFPIEGDIGARLVNSMVNMRSIQRTAQYKIVNGNRTLVTEQTPVTVKSNFVDILPSVNAIVHFTPKLMLRLAYTGDVQRPPSYQLNPQLFLNLENTLQPTATGGNAQLGPIVTSKYDASLEWYFGATGLASLAVWQWNQRGFVFYRTLPEFLPESPNVPVLVTRPYALGQGRHRGIEGRVSTFFSFLPGILKSFGAEVNGTLNITRTGVPSFDPVNPNAMTFSYSPYFNVSKYTYNLIGFFEKDGLNIRVAYNWRSRVQRDRSLFNPYLNVFADPIERLDASINYDITKNLTVALEASNLTRNGIRSFWGSYEMPQDVRFFSRNYAISVRTRF